MIAPMLQRDVNALFCDLFLSFEVGLMGMLLHGGGTDKHSSNRNVGMNTLHRHTALAIRIYGPCYGPRYHPVNAFVRLCPQLS